jgi:hypothetical protein
MRLHACGPFSFPPVCRCTNSLTNSCGGCHCSSLRARFRTNQVWSPSYLATCPPSGEGVRRPFAHLAIRTRLGFGRLRPSSLTVPWKYLVRRLSPSPKLLANPASLLIISEPLSSGARSGIPVARAPPAFVGTTCRPTRSRAGREGHRVRNRFQTATTSGLSLGHIMLKEDR